MSQIRPNCLAPFFLICFGCLQVVGQESDKKTKQSESNQPTRTIEFKTTPQGKLHLHYFAPEGDTDQKRPAIVFFFGGGWVGGTPAQFYPQCKHLAEQGIAAFSAEYRVRSRHKTTPFECVADGKSAVRWIRAHAADFQIDPDRIVASGGSAGGHVAACTALVVGMDDEPSSQPAGKVSSVPNALVLYNPVIDTSKKGFGYKALKKRFAEISPLEQVRKDLPPTLIFQGTADTTTPATGHQEFQKRMKQHNNVCELELFPGEKHGFFNPGRSKAPSRNKGFAVTTQSLDRFLTKIGYLPVTNSKTE